MLLPVVFAAAALANHQMRVTYISTASVLLEVGSLRILTDPVFDPAGQTYKLGFGTSSTKTENPALSADAIRAEGLDVVLLSHDRHADNLDDAGRALLDDATVVLTTRPAARRLGGNAVGLRAWESYTVEGEGGFSLEITATRARHGPPLSLGVVGRVVGFVLKWKGQQRGVVYISGDTVYYRGIQRIAARFQVGTAFLHVGGVRFPRLAGRTLFTMDAEQAAAAARLFEQATIVPLHYDGWTHFLGPVEALQQTLRAPDLAPRTRWLPKGKSTVLGT